MATRSTIAMEFADGTVQQIYCHWDGYLEHNGKMLLEHYMDPFKVRALIDGGAVSSLSPELDPGNDNHSFNQPKAGVTVFYARDRGEELSIAKFKDYADYRRRAQGEEYNYILRNVNGQATWFVEFYGEFDGLLTEALEIQAEEAAE